MASHQFCDPLNTSTMGTLRTALLPYQPNFAGNAKASSHPAHLPRKNLTSGHKESFLELRLWTGWWFWLLEAKSAS